MPDISLIKQSVAHKLRDLGDGSYTPYNTTLHGQPATTTTPTGSTLVTTGLVTSLGYI